MRIKTLTTNNIAVTKVKGKAFFKNFLNPFLKFLLFISYINPKECLTEWRKQKYIVKATNGEKNALRVKIVTQSAKKKPPLFDHCIIKKFAMKLIRSNDIRKFLCVSIELSPRILKIWRVSSVWKKSGATTTTDPLNK